MGELEYADCLESMEQADELMYDKSFQLPSHRVLAGAHLTRCSGHDSQFIALSEDLGVSLYTYDKRIPHVYPDSVPP
jgi:hypothetical protein